MNDINPTPEQTKKAEFAYARGFLDQAIAGLGQSPESAKAFYKRATTHFTKLASIAAAIRAHINPPVSAK